MFSLQHLDHVAIRTSDPEKSAQWYLDVLGLSRVSIPEWHPYPIMMMSGEQGIAIFPPIFKKEVGMQTSLPVRIDHIAFRVDVDNFTRAQSHFERLGIPFTIQDHVYFHSIYVQDPDGHQIELTTLIQPFPKSLQHEH